MTKDLSRLLRPKSIAVLGGAWAQNVVQQCQLMGFEGEIWPIHPTKTEVHGLKCYRGLPELPSAPDATFIGVNRNLTIQTVQTLQDMGAGGAVCFAAGFDEAGEAGGDLQNQLLDVAGDMPIIGPNCYGLISYLDGALLWPDQHGGKRVDTGVAIITQSSNIAINMSMQKRGLPIAYLGTAGNQAQLGLADLGMAFLEDPRVTALGLHIEGFGDIRAFERLALRADQLGKKIIAIKVGRSEQARAATVSHTASLAGEDTGAQALLDRLGIRRLGSIAAFMETLKLLHLNGPLARGHIASISCSGGEASLIADSALDFPRVSFPELSKKVAAELSQQLGPLVKISNPLDYHTFIWNDLAAMTGVFTSVLKTDIDLGCFIFDVPR
ncbi:MAG: CoA-binding protein, partial [Alphaproteobacteria bacterium]